MIAAAKAEVCPGDNRVKESRNVAQGEGMATKEAFIDLPDPIREPAGPCLIVIFGAAGDLTKRKLIPSLYNLAKAQLLPKEFAVVGFARNEMTTEVFREKLNEEINQYTTERVDPALWDWLVQRLYYQSGTFTDESAYQQLRALLSKVDQE